MATATPEAHLQRLVVKLHERRDHAFAADDLADPLDEVLTGLETRRTRSGLDIRRGLEGLAAGLDDGARDTVENATTRIYEACGFQGITGQRVTKVVGALKEIEAKIDAMLIAFGSEIERERKKQPARKENNERPTDEELLAGPQKRGEAISRDDIDKLLAESD